MNSTPEPPELGDDDAAQLAGWYRAGSTAWPEVAIDAKQFETFILARVPEGTSLSEFAASSVLADLYLVCACCLGNAAAIAQVEHLLGEQCRRLSSLLARTRAAEDVVQDVRVRLLVASDEQPASIATYTGRGKLSSWLRVLLTRQALMRLRSEKRSKLDLGDELLKEAPWPQNMEAMLARPAYQAELKQAFAVAVSAITAKQRNLLRLYALDKLSVEQIGAAYGVHRSTAFRWLTATFELLAELISQRLSRALGVSPQELESVLRGIGSDVSLSLPRVLAEDK